jgi:HEAT repeat protein
MTAEAGAVSGLVNLLSSSDDAVQEQAAQAPQIMADNCEAAAAVVAAEPEALTGLVLLLSSSNGDVQQQAARALRAVAAGSSARAP